MRFSYLLYASALLFSLPSMAATFNDLTAQPADKVQVIDCRDSNFFNGWPQAGQKQGGHIANAVNIDASWLPLLDDGQFKALLKQDDLVATKPTYLYCELAGTQVLAHELNKQGFTDIHSINQPLSMYQGKLVALPNFQHLVSAAWLNNLIHGGEVNYAPKSDFKVVEVNWGPPTKYLIRHIPGAHYLNTNDIESEPLWNHVPPVQLAKVLSNLDINQNTTVIVYGHNTMAAERAAQIMMYAGVKDVRLLNGGFPAWLAGGYDTEAFYNGAKNTPKFGTTIPANPDAIIDVAQVKNMLKDTTKNSVVSVRSWPEYMGETSGYDYIKAKGRIKGAKWGQSGVDAYHMNSYFNPDQTYRNPYAIAKLWKQWGIEPQQNVSFYCGTGWRASVAYFDAYLMGWPNISVFDGGWLEWSLQQQPQK